MLWIVAGDLFVRYAETCLPKAWEKYQTRDIPREYSDFGTVYGQILRRFRATLGPRSLWNACPRAEIMFDRRER